MKSLLLRLEVESVAPSPSSKVIVFRNAAVFFSEMQMKPRNKLDLYSRFFQPVLAESR